MLSPRRLPPPRLSSLRDQICGRTSPVILVPSDLAVEPRTHMADGLGMRLWVVVTLPAADRPDWTLAVRGPDLPVDSAVARDRAQRVEQALGLIRPRPPGHVSGRALRRGSFARFHGTHQVGVARIRSEGEDPLPPAVERIGRLPDRRVPAGVNRRAGAVRQCVPHPTIPLGRMTRPAAKQPGASPSLRTPPWRTHARNPPANAPRPAMPIGP